jgi:hypothetical protein
MRAASDAGQPIRSPGPGAIERASRDEISALPWHRLPTTLRHAHAHVPHPMPSDADLFFQDAESFSALRPSLPSMPDVTGSTR